MRDDLPALGDIAPTRALICDTCDVVTLVGVLIPQRSRGHFIKATSSHPDTPGCVLGGALTLALDIYLHTESQTLNRSRPLQLYE